MSAHPKRNRRLAKFLNPSHLRRLDQSTVFARKNPEFWQSVALAVATEKA
jgi:hypothetical protein